MSNPVAAVYLSAIDTALGEAVDGVPEARLRELAPLWFLNALVAEGVYDRTKERRQDARGVGQWVWRKKGPVD